MIRPTAVPGEESAVVLHGRVDSGAAAADLDTLVQARAVASALRALGLSVETMELGLDLERARQRLLAVAPGVVFNLVEQVACSDRLLPLAPFLLERLEIRYTGCPGTALAITTDKVAAKLVMQAAGIPTPPWLEPSSSGASLPGSGEETRWIVKSATEHSSFGLDGDAVVPGTAVAGRIGELERRHGGRWFAERYVHGREINVSILAGAQGPVVLPLAEIDFVDFPQDRPMIVDYAAKWDTLSDAYRDTPRRFLGGADQALSDRLRAIALRCWDVFGLKGYARVDFRIDPSGRPWVLEINGNPCLSPDAGFAAAAEEAGIDYLALIGTIVRDAGMALPLPKRASAG